MHYERARADHDHAGAVRLRGVEAEGLSAETLRLVEERLRSAEGDLSVAEMAALRGLSRVSARRDLEHLVETWKAEVSLRYGEVGRRAAGAHHRDRLRRAGRHQDAAPDHRHHRGTHHRALTAQDVDEAFAEVLADL